jgi:hypothetical protein
MAHNLKLSNAAVNAKADALAALANNGYLRIYSGSQPADADSAITSQVLLAEVAIWQSRLRSGSRWRLNRQSLYRRSRRASHRNGQLVSSASIRRLDRSLGRISWGKQCGPDNGDHQHRSHMIVSLNSLTHTVSKG